MRTYQAQTFKWSTLYKRSYINKAIPKVKKIISYKSTHQLQSITKSLKVALETSCKGQIHFSSLKPRGLYLTRLTFFSQAKGVIGTTLKAFLGAIILDIAILKMLWLVTIVLRLWSLGK